MERPNQQQGERRQEGPHLQGNKRALTDSQLMQNLITEVIDEKEDELTDDKATAFLSEQELKYLRQERNLFSMIRDSVFRLGVNREDWSGSNLRDKFLKNMSFLTQTSKSKGGVAMKLLKTEKVVQEQDLYETRGIEQEESMRDKILKKVQNSDQQVIGNPETGSYTDKNKDDNIW